MIQRPNPLNVETLGTLGGSTIDEQVKDLHRRIDDAHQARQAWTEKQERLLRQRRGVRKDKVFPWPGAVNHSWPLTDGVVRRWKPGMVALITGTDPVAYFFATKPEAVRAAPAAQAFYHWRFWSMANVRETAMELVDYVAQHGTAYTRQGWDYRTRKMCRIISVPSLFPNGVDAAVEQYNQQAAAASQQLQEAVAAGQAPPEALQQAPQQTTALELVLQTIEEEYVISAEEPLERQQVEEAVTAILNGAQQVRLYYQIVTADRPAWKAFSPLDVVVPPRTPCIEDADYVAFNHRFLPDDLRKLAVDGHLNPGRTQEVIEKIESGRRQSEEAEWEDHSYYGAIRDVKDRADGVDPRHANDDDAATNVWEVFCKLDIDGDGLLEKCVLWYHPESKTTLALYPLPTPFEEWPVVRFQFEHLSNRPYEPRGIAELCAVFQATVNKLHNARLDAVQITLAPMFQMRAPAGEVNRNIKFMPGAIIPVQAVGDLAPIVMDTKPIIQLMQEENLTKALAEQYVGIFDPSVMAQNAVERRTATEVEATMQQTQAVFGQDAALFQDAMQKVHKQLWHLILEFDREEVYFRVTGEEQPRLAKKHEIAYDYDIVPAGTPANTSKQLAMARTREAMQLFLQDQTGLINKSELIKSYFDVLDRNLGKLIIRPPEEAAAIQAVMQAMNTTMDEQGVPPAQRPTAP
jgi:hypothetical protein